MRWSGEYTGLPHCLRAHNGSRFRKSFAELSTLHEVEIEESGAQAHHSLATGERYHKSLRDTLRKLELDFPRLKRQGLLALTVKAMNDTLGPEGIVPSFSFFGDFPSISSFDGPLIPHPSLAERLTAAQEARRLMLKHLAAVKVKRSLHYQTPSALDRD